MTRILTKCAILLGGLYAAGLALWHLGNTVVFVFSAEHVPGTVEDSTKRPFEGIVEQLSHGNMPWEGDVAYHPHVKYTIFNLPRTDTELPDLDNRDYADKEPVEILINPRDTHQRHINKFKFLWVGDLLLLALGVLLLLIARMLLRRKKRERKPAPHRQAPAPVQAPHPEPAEKPTPAPRRKKAAPKEAEEAPVLVLEAESTKDPAPRKRRRKSTTGSTTKSTSRTRKTADAADKPKTPRRRKKTQESS